MLHPNRLPPITHAQFDLLDDAADHHAPTRRFLLFVVANQLDPRRTTRRLEVGRMWVDAGSKFVEKHFRGADWRRLAGVSNERELESVDFSSLDEEGRRGEAVLKHLGYRRSQGRSFCVSPSFLRAFLQAGIRTVERAPSATVVDVTSGHRSRRVAHSRTYDGNRKPYPPLVDAVLRALTEGQFDARAVEEHLAASEEVLSEEVLRGALSGSASRSAPSRSERRHQNDRLCYEAVLRQRPRHAGGGVYAYPLAFTVASTGRISQVGGGLQSASGAMKAAAYRSLPGVRNYDLAASQLVVLEQEMREAGLEAHHVRRYLERPSLRAEAAAFVGIEEKDFKKAFYPVLFGSPLLKPERVTAERVAGLRRRSKVVRVLWEAVWTSVVGTEWSGERDARGEISRRVGQTYERFYGVVAPVEAEVDPWRRYVVEKLAQETGTRWRGELLLPNRLGMRLNLSRIRSVPARQRRAAAHILQGREAMLVHDLTLRLLARGLPVVANEHDGLVVLGEVPAADFEAAKATVGLPGARLEEKPFEWTSAAGAVTGLSEKRPAPDL